MATTWEITAQRQVSELNAQGTFDDAMEVSFATLPEGIPGVVKIPIRVYGPDYVRDVIESRVSAIKAVQAL